MAKLDRTVFFRDTVDWCVSWSHVWLLMLSCEHVIIWANVILYLGLRPPDNFDVEPPVERERGGRNRKLRRISVTVLLYVFLPVRDLLARPVLGRSEKLLSERVHNVPCQMNCDESLHSRTAWLHCRPMVDQLITYRIAVRSTHHGFSSVCWWDFRLWDARYRSIQAGVGRKVSYRARCEMQPSKQDSMKWKREHKSLFFDLCSKPTVYKICWLTKLRKVAV